MKNRLVDRRLRRWQRASRRVAALLAALSLAACSLLPRPDTTVGREGAPPASPGTREVPTVRLITAQTPAVRAYRKLAATQIYKRYPQRIYKGKIPPLVYAVVVVETELDADGRVTAVNFSRTPGHAPEVAPMIAQLIKAASPLPPPPRGIGAHTYVETWLWDKSGKFQLDTLTKGQRSR